jgi:hypothetical protein
MFRSKRPQFSVTIARAALESIFDECDQYDSHETGGRLIGTYQKKGAHYTVQLSGVLGPGPAAQRSATSFFQDGDYQERIFRQIEQEHPNIEHLGNWHTHHVNGLATLSGGDHATYQRIVNHDKHNTDFFYALLVVRKNHGRDPRYDVRHYFFRRNDERVYETSPTQVQIVDAPILWPVTNGQSPSPSASAYPSAHHTQPNVERAKDQEFFSDFYPNLKASFSESVQALYWKGAVTLIDGSHVKVLTMENSGNGYVFYSITAGSGEPALAEVLSAYSERQFRSARHAVLHLQAESRLVGTGAHELVFEKW